MRQSKKSVEQTELGNIVKSRTNSFNKKLPIEILDRKINLKSYFTPNGFGVKQKSFQKSHGITVLSGIKENTKKQNSISSKKKSTDIRFEILSNSHFGSRKSNNNFQNPYFNSMMTNAKVDIPPEFVTHANFKKKALPNHSLSKSRNKSFKNLSLQNENHRIGILESQQNIKSNNSPINIFNIKNYTVLANQEEAGHKKSPSYLEENLAILKEKKPISKQLRQFLSNSKSFSGNKIVKGINTINVCPKKDEIENDHEKNITSKKITSLEKIGSLINKITYSNVKKIDFRCQKSFQEYHQINFSSTNINSLVKDIAKSKLVKKIMQENEKQVGPPKPESMKEQIILETISMTQEQLFFEELLQILSEKGVDVENLFAYCYERLKIDTFSATDLTEDKNSNFKILSDSLSCLNSEISLLDNASVVLQNKRKLSEKKKKLQLDMRNVRQEIFSSNEEN